MNKTKKRKIDAETPKSPKRLKLTTSSASQAVQTTSSDTQLVTMDQTPDTDVKEMRTTRPDSTPVKDTDVKEMRTTRPDSTPVKRRRINKLLPPRPFPTVPTSASATGPRSAHKEGKNFICVTRKTALGAYMRRCKDVVLKDGYKTLHFSAMGAAIPLLLQLVVALPPILPFASDEIKTEVTSGTVEVQDEVIPDDDDEDLTYETRGKSTLKIILKFGDGEFDGDKGGSVKKNGKNRSGIGGGKGTKSRGKEAPTAIDSEDIVLQEPEQEDMEML